MVCNLVLNPMEKRIRRLISSVLRQEFQGKKHILIIMEQFYQKIDGSDVNNWAIIIIYFIFMYKTSMNYYQRPGLETRRVINQATA